MARKFTLKSSLSAEQQLAKASRRLGWDERSEISVLTEFVEEQKATKAFARFLEGRVCEEESLT